MSNPKTLVLIATAATGAIAAARDLANDRTPSVRLIAGVWIAGVLLALLAEVAPQLAAALAALMLVTAIFAGAPDVWQAVARVSDPDPDRSPTLI